MTEKLKILTKKRRPSYLKGLTGPLHPAYKHGQGNIRATTALELKQLACWKKTVLANDHFKCFLSNEKTSKKDPLVCHHLEGWNRNKALRFDVRNGICLKKSIHRVFHETYGFGNNTRRQFEKFSKDFYQINHFPWTKGNHEPSVTIENVKNELKTLKQQKEFEIVAPR